MFSHVTWHTHKPSWALIIWIGSSIAIDIRADCKNTIHHYDVYFGCLLKLALSRLQSARLNTYLIIWNWILWCESCSFFPVARSLFSFTIRVDSFVVGCCRYLEPLPSICVPMALIPDQHLCLINMKYIRRRAEVRRIRTLKSIRA